MYIPSQFLIAIDNDRLATAARDRRRALARRDARLAREDGLAGGRGGRSKGRLGRGVTRVFGHRTAPGAAA